MTASQYHVAFSSADVEPGVFRVRRLSIDEAISVECTCDVELVSDNALLDPRALLGKAATVTLIREDGSVLRRFHGQVRSVHEKASTTPNRLEFRVHLASLLAKLADSSDYKIFQEMTAKDVISEILKNHGIPDDVVEWRTGSQIKRKTCTQYGETTRDFVNRVLEHEGVYWFCEHLESGPHIVFADAAAGYSDLGGDAIPFKDAFGFNGDEFVTSTTASSRVRPAKLTLRDHDFTKPTLKLDVTDEAETALGREHYEYPARQLDSNGLKARATAMHIAQTVAARQTHLHGPLLRLVAGHVVALQGSPDGRTDGRFAVVRVSHRWTPTGESEGELATNAWVIAADQRYVPLPTPQPNPVGDLALVTVPSGEDIHTNEHGQISVLYHWDRHGEQNEKSSGWTRVTQMHTSGSVVLPRRAWEVMIEFEHADPERPCVVGRLYNATSPPVDTLPGNKTNSVLSSYGSPSRKGHNEIRMNDGGGSELVQVHAEKDLNLVVANNKEEKVATMATIGVAVNQTVKVGADQTEKVGAAENLTVGGSQTHKVGASRTKSVSSDEKHDIGGSRSLTIGAGHTTMTPMTCDTSTKSSLSETVSGLCLEAAALGVSLAVAGSTSITVGGAKIEAVATGKADMTIGARASTVGGAFVNVTPKDILFSTSGVKVTTVGGAWLANAGGDVEISSNANISITVGGAVALTAAKVVLKVGGSNVTLSAGQVVIEASEVSFTASGPCAELSAGVQSK